ncbi:MAG: pantoate--beta-alanine ligase [Acidobacteriaceae bacterium]|jgi:pantoate--beta-alanine ligase|nr:pantoate--beta-alanine ligase [Acidobacteriaceae bacterium]
MQVLSTIQEMRLACRAVRQSGQSLGLVPTMGALHAGHIALVRAARAQCDVVAASIFVNPTQFGPNEDFAKYPRPFEQDCALLEGEGVALVFAPQPGEMYPAGASTFVEVGGVGDRLDGASRPGHFRGVATIVAKLFHIVGPDKAFFGQKDAAQVAVLRSMVRDLNFDLELVVCPTLREPDGLALSSRNRYLSASDRARALVLSRALDVIAATYRAGEKDVARLLETGRSVMATEPEVRIDYLQIVDADTLLPLTEAKPGALVAIAAYVGGTRLIDNTILR